MKRHKEKKDIRICNRCGKYKIDEEKWAKATVKFLFTDLWAKGQNDERQQWNVIWTKCPLCEARSACLSVEKI